MEVTQHNGDLCASDDEDDEHQAQEAEQVVELVQPHGCQDEEELDEDCSKGQNAANEDAEHRVHVPGLLWNLPGDLVSSHWVLQRWGFVAKVRADKHKGYGDAEPQEAQGKEGAKRHGA